MRAETKQGNTMDGKDSAHERLIEQAKDILFEHRCKVADIMEKYAIESPRIKPYRKSAFQDEIRNLSRAGGAKLAQVIEAEASRREQALLDDLVQMVMSEQSTYMNPRIFGEPDFTDGVSQGKNQAYGRLLQHITALKGKTGNK
jgi:hypothetical protein